MQWEAGGKGIQRTLFPCKHAAPEIVSQKLFRIQSLYCLLAHLIYVGQHSQ